MPNQTDRDIIDALLRQMDPYNTPQGSPDVLAQLGARLESAGTQLEGSLQGRNELERMAELIPRWLAANPMQEAGALMQMRQPEVEQLKTMARQAAADPMGTAEAVGRAGVGAIKDPLGTAEKLSLPDIMGGGKALTSLGRMGRKLRGPDLIESVMPEAKVERPSLQVEPSQRLPEVDAEKARLDRAAKQGFDIEAFHGTKGDISAFDPGLLGATTSAPSARKGFFFSADSETAAAYAKAADPVKLGRISEDEFDARLKILSDRQSELTKKTMEIDDQVNEAIGVNASQRMLNAIDSEITKHREPRPLDEKIKQLLAEEDFLGFETKGQAARAILDNDDWSNRWDVRNPSTVEEIETWKKMEKQKEAQSKVGLDKLLKQRDSAAEVLSRSYDDYSPYVDKHFPEMRQLESEIDDLEGRIDRGEVGQGGDNIMPVKLKLQNPLEHDFGNQSYREVSYHDLLEQAQREGRDGAIFRNTHDGGDLTDIYVVFNPSQIRSRYAMFDPKYEPTMSLSDDAPIAQNLMDEWDEKLPKLETEKSELEQKWTDQWKQLELLEGERSTAEKNLRQGEKMRIKWYQENTDNLDQWGNYSKRAADIERLSAGDRSLYDEFMRKHESMESNMSKLSNNYNQSVDAIEELENRQAAISTQLPKLTEEIEFIKKEYPFAKGKTQPQISGTGDILAGAAPVVLPLGAGAAAEAYLANQEQ